MQENHTLLDTKIKLAYFRCTSRMIDWNQIEHIRKEVIDSHLTYSASKFRMLETHI